MVGEYAPTGKDAVSAYLRDAELEGRPARSIGTYRSSLSLLLASDEPLVSLNIRELLHQRCTGLASNSVISVLAAHRSFVRYCLDQGWLQLDPLRGLKSPKKRETPHRFLTPSEVRQLWDCADDLLDRAALVLLTLGLRAGEVCAVKPSDVGRDGEGAYVRVRTQKGGTPRLLPLTEASMAVLEALPARGTLLGITPHRLWERITRLGRRAGVPVHPHELRHAFAMAWLDETGDQGTLQTLLGHRSATMSRWYARSALEKVALRKARTVRLWE